MSKWNFHEIFMNSVHKVQQNMLDFLNGNTNIIEKLISLISENEIDKPTLLEYTFSLRNENGKKVLRILGIKITIKRRKYAH